MMYFKCDSLAYVYHSIEALHGIKARNRFQGKIYSCFANMIIITSLFNYYVYYVKHIYEDQKGNL